MLHNPNRRGFFRTCAWVTAGAVLGVGYEEKALLANATEQEPAITTGNLNRMPQGSIGKAKISRLIPGGNLVGGVGHSRDLKYISDLINNYFTDKKILDTWEIAEECGINAMSACSTFRSGKMRWLRAEYSRRNSTECVHGEVEKKRGYSGRESSCLVTDDDKKSL